MSRFAVGQEITVKEGCGSLEYGKFYPITMITDHWNIISMENDHRVWVSDMHALTREEYEQAEREKDPFAPGKWVVCVRDDWPAKVGDIIQVFNGSVALGGFRVRDAMSPSRSTICFKSNFRPATPEEIKEMKIMDEKKGDEDRANRQTFTVGGQEFYVGQSAWLKSAFIGLPKDAPVEILGYNYGGDVLAVREAGSSLVGFIPSLRKITTTKPKPHEWKFGDWARHPEFGVVFVTSSSDAEGDIEAVRRDDGEGVCLGAEELTYISTSEIPE